MAVYLLAAWGIWVAFNLGLLLLCALFIKPSLPCFNGFAIVIPTWLSKVLTEDELRAVEAHERGHQRLGHVWKNLLWRFVFVTKNPAERLQQEFEADDFAAAEGRALALAVALRKLSRHPDDVMRSERLLQRMGI